MTDRNLLFLYTDEQAAGTLKAYGNHSIVMPNLNALAAQSTVFDRAYVTQPVCTPSRSSLLTGLYPHTTGCTRNNVALHSHTKCFPELLAPGRYKTAHIGKWHLGDEIFTQHGFDEFVSIEDNYISHYSEGRDRTARSSYHHFLIENGFTPKNGSIFGRGEVARFPEEYSKTAFVANESIRFLTEHRDDRFALFVNFLEPHMPFFGPRDAMYDRSDIPLPQNYDSVPDRAVPIRWRAYFDRHRRPDAPSDEKADSAAEWRDLIARYWGLCSQVDTHVGRILATLTELGLDENTVVVYTSDHGDMMGAHQLVAKCVQFEEAARVPLLIRVPGASDAEADPSARTHAAGSSETEVNDSGRRGASSVGRRIQRPISQIDLVPTLVDLLGEELPDHLQGKSRRSFFEGSAPGADPAEDIVFEWNPGPLRHDPKTGLLRQEGAGDLAATTTIGDGVAEVTRSAEARLRTIVTAEGLKLTASEAGDHELYNLQNDPYEQRNLALDPAQGPLIHDLIDRIEAWQKRTGDAVELPRAVDMLRT